MKTVYKGNRHLANASVVMWFSALPLLFASGCLWMPPAPVTRADLGTSLKRFERRYAANPPAGARVAELSRAFDQATTSFFFGNYAEVVKGIEGAAAMLSANGPSDAERVAASLKFRLTPSAYVLGSGAAPGFRLTSMYEVTLASESAIVLKLRVVNEAGEKIHEQPIEVQGAASTRIDILGTLTIDLTKLKRGNHRVELVTAEGAAFAVLNWPAVERSPAQGREANAARLAPLSFDSPALQQALASARARNALLLDPPGEDRVIEFVIDRSALEASVADEVERLAAGENPYFHRKGDYWRVFKREGDEIPLRVYCPAGLDVGKPVPVVVAWHGYGGDENLFPEGYGAGLVKRLADQHGFLLVCPLTYPFLNSPVVFDRLLEVIGHDYTIDASRVYVMGHSLGAACAASIAPRRADRIAAACLFAGGSNLADADRLPPTVVFLGGADLVSPPERSRPGVQAAIGKGLPVELREKPDLGHTILVSESLADGVTFLMQKVRSAPRRK